MISAFRAATRDLTNLLYGRTFLFRERWPNPAPLAIGRRRKRRALQHTLFSQHDLSVIHHARGKTNTAVGQSQGVSVPPRHRMIVLSLNSVPPES
jgi:hypothetical protein